MVLKRFNNCVITSRLSDCNVYVMWRLALNMLGISPFKSAFCLTETFSGFAPNNARGISPTRTSLDLMATNTDQEDAMMQLCRARLI